MPSKRLLYLLMSLRNVAFDRAAQWAWRRGKRCYLKSTLESPVAQPGLFLLPSHGVALLAGISARLY